MKDFYFSDEQDAKEFLLKNKWLINSLIVEGVRKSIDEGLEKLTIFRIINPISGYILTTEINKYNLINSLNKCLEFYESIEEYEMCDRIIKMKEEIKNGDTKTNKG
jgi:hypothetical protein